jgi:hypothetical protein
LVAQLLGLRNLEALGSFHLPLSQALKGVGQRSIAEA